MVENLLKQEIRVRGGMVVHLTLFTISHYLVIWGILF